MIHSETAKNGQDNVHTVQDKRSETFEKTRLRFQNDRFTVIFLSR
jgi:hypothetical protein